MKSRLLALFALALVGCDTGSLGADAGAATVDAPAADAPGLDAHVVPTTTSSATVGPIRGVSRGEEETVCMGLVLDNAMPGSIVAIRTHLTEGSHHMIVSRADDASPSAPTPCQPFALGIDRTIFIAQQREAGLTYPPGSGLRVDAHQPIRLELHYINYFSDAPADISGTVEFDIATDDGSLRQVQLLFTGDLAFTLPARMETTIHSTYTLPVGAELFAITSHTHSLGIDATIDIANPAAPRRLHESSSWSDPPLDVFEPPLVLGLADELSLTCIFQNTTDRTVHFGENFDSEMCFLWAYYLDPL